jgi:predicted kinase
MPVLVLLGGGPAAGKSTLARAWVASRPGALALDIDVIRAMIGGWQDDRIAAGLAAREIAVAAARTHLCAGHDVIVPQLLARPDFIDRLAVLADEVDARFVEVLLRTPTSIAEERHRGRATDGPEGALTAEVAAMTADVEAFAATRQATRFVDTADTLDETVARLDAAIDAGSA